MNTQINDGGQQMSTTPRTDEQVMDWTTEDGSDIVFASMARELETELAAEREKVRVLRAELTNIAAANPAHWGDEMDQFMPWAQNRARHTLIATEDTP